MNCSNSGCVGPHGSVRVWPLANQDFLVYTEKIEKQDSVQILSQIQVNLPVHLCSAQGQSDYIYFGCSRNP